MKKAEREHLNKVAALGCIACYNWGFPHTPAAIHHIRAGQGMSQRASNYEVIPLCPYHHQEGATGQAIHAGRKSWEANHGTERDLLAQVLQMLGVTA